MKLKNTNICIDDAIKFSDYDNLLLKRRDNNMLLSDFQVNVLLNNGIDYKIYSNIRELLFKINIILADNYQEELDLVASQISEIIYYSETKK